MHKLLNDEPRPENYEHLTLHKLKTMIEHSQLYGVKYWLECYHRYNFLLTNVIDNEKFSSRYKDLTPDSDIESHLILVDLRKVLRTLNNILKNEEELSDWDKALIIQKICICNQLIKFTLIGEYFETDPTAYWFIRMLRRKIAQFEVMVKNSYADLDNFIDRYHKRVKQNEVEFKKIPTDGIHADTWPK